MILTRIIVGVDEVGRGCFAGPVVAAAVAFPGRHIPIVGVDDSKRLTPNKRAQLDIEIRQATSFIGIGQVEAKEIDQIGIVAAVSQAMTKACQQIPQIDKIFVDGPTPLGLEQLCAQVTPIIHGDHLKYVIGAASILAKVYRDTLMEQYARQYPMYGWEHNVGYGTLLHRKAIRAHGITSLHRRSFIHAYYP